MFMTETADYADILLPAPSQPGTTDFYKAYCHTVLTYNAPAIAPLSECKSNWEVMGLMARAMGFTEPWLFESPDDIIRDVLASTARQRPWMRGITLEQLKVNGAVPMNIGDDPPFADGRFPT